MKRSDHSPRPFRPSRWVAFVTAVALTLFGAAAVAPATADTPPTPVASPFNAPLCENTTGDPSVDADGGPVTNLLSVFGQRLIDYNNGKPVILYNNSGRSGLPGQYAANPVCVVRYVDEVAGPVSTWSFCTFDRASACSWTNLQGELERSGTVLPGLTDTSPDERLTADQQKLQAYIIQNDIPVSAGPTGSGGSVPADTIANNDTPASRSLRQDLVHCIDNPDRSSGLVFCANNMSPTLQARILEIIGADPSDQLSATAPSASVVPGGEGEIAVTTTLAGIPIDLAITGGTVTVCDGPATLTGTTLLVDVDAPLPTTITLCATRPDAGLVTVGLQGEPPVIGNVGFFQSNPGDTLCQIFSSYYSEQQQVVSASANVEFVDLQPSIGTTLLDDLDQDHYLAQSGGTLVDTVTYSDLLPNTEYVVSGELMDQESGDSTGVVGETIFTSSGTGSGTVDVEFTVGSGFAGQGLVAFESLSLDDSEVASHEDLEDDAQTVWVADIGTTLTDGADGDKIVPATGGTVIDTVSYVNLEPSTAYTLSGELYDKGTGLATGIVGSLDFVSSATGEGEVDVALIIPATYAAKSLVAFEVLTQASTVVATHEDIDDRAQTVTVLAKTAISPTTPQLAGTGQALPIAPLALASLMVFAGAILLVRRRRAQS